MTNDIRINVNELHPLLYYYLKKIIKYANKEGIYIIVTEGLRTKERQDQLYAQGRFGNPGIVVTNARGSDYASQHQWGIAFDICIANPGHTWDVSYFRKVAEIATKRCKHIGWGGYWTKEVDGLIDNPHFYLTFWGKNPSPLKEKYGTPYKFFKTFKGTIKATTKHVPLWNYKKDKKLASIPNGSSVYVSRIGRKWAHIRYKDTYGYVLKKYVK